MQAVIELQTLPEGQQRALHAAVRGNGLSLWLGSYVVTQYVAEETGLCHARPDVAALQRRGLLTDAYPVRVTDDGMELVNCGRVARELEPA